MATNNLSTLLLVFALSAVPSTSVLGETVDLSSARVIDLTHPFNADTLYWPTAPSTFDLKTLHKGQTAGGFYYSANLFCAPEHGGTHLDAPSHFAENGWTSAEIPVNRFVGPAVVIDISHKANEDRDYVLSVEDITAWEEAHGTIPRGAIVLLRTGWSSRWPNRLAYFGDDAPGVATNLHFPSYGQEAAKVLVRDRAVSMIGADTASIDNGPSRDFPVHRLASAANVAGLENLTNLQELPPTGAVVVALPMKITDGSGGPVRVIALVSQ
jgi:kynurenine formamidase